MKIVYRIEGDEDLKKALGALPIGLQHACYGAGFRQAGAGVARKAKAAAPVGKGIAWRRGRRALREKRLFESIRVRLIPWHWDGRKVPKSAAIVVAEQPHAHLVEIGARGPYKSRKPQPFLWPALQDKAALMTDFKRGAQRQFARVVRQVERGKLTKQTARALRLGGG